MAWAKQGIHRWYGYNMLQILAKILENLSDIRASQILKKQSNPIAA